MAVRIAVLVILALHVVVASASDFMWIERDWISNAELSRKANPSIEGFNEDGIKRFNDLFGKTIWRFKDGIFTGIQLPHGVQGSSPYFIRPAGEDRFEVILDDEDFDTIFTLWRVELGFCATPNPTWIAEYRSSTEPGIVECYVPDDGHTQAFEVLTE